MTRTILTGFVFSCVLAATAWCQEWPTAPTDDNGRKWRIGYFEGGAYKDYQTIFLKIVSAMMDQGWIETMPLPEQYDPDHKQVWEWVAENVRSDYLEFVKDAFYTSGFKAELRQQTRTALLNRVNEQQDLDLILAMGTWAGLDLVNDAHTVPTVVASVSDPLGSGIIQDVDDSGFDHVHVKVEPERYLLQLRLFHDIIRFTSMGLVYEDSAEGRTFGAVNDAERMAAERGFELKHCHARFNDVTREQASQEVLKCYEELAPQIDSMYIATHRGVNLENLSTLLAPLTEHEVASFAMNGSEFVKHGALLSIAHAGYTYAGRFHADVIAKIFNGAKPRDLTQSWTPPPAIALNLETAEAIGFDPPFDVLAAADDIFERIEPCP